MAVTITPTGTATSPWRRPSLFLVAQPYTFMLWWNCSALPTSTAGDEVVGLLGQAARQGLQLHHDGSNVRAGVGTTTNNYDGNTVISANTWYHSAWTRSGTTHNVYLNGALNRTAFTDAETVGAGLLIGDRDVATAADEFGGSITAVKIWNRPLLEVEIQLEMLQIAPIRWASIFGFWPLIDLGSETYDFSGRGNTLTLAGTHADATIAAPVPYLLREITTDYDYFPVNIRPDPALMSWKRRQNWSYQ